MITSEQASIHRVTFDATIDEMVDVGLLSVRASKEARRWKRDAIIGTSFGAGLGIVLFLIAAHQLPPTPAAVVGLVVGVAVGLLYGAVYDNSVRKRTERLLREQIGDGPVACVMEVRPEGLWSETRGVTTTFPWTLLQSVAETPRGIELQFQGGIAVVRDRAFATVQARSAFIRRIHELKAVS